jgi:hypothetical protein
MGQAALVANTTASNNVAIGRDAMFVNTTGHSNVAVGYQSLYSNTTGTSNVAVGYLAADANTEGYAITAIGENALGGREALKANTTANNNTAVGEAALKVNTTASDNTALGAGSQASNTTGNNNISAGTNSMSSNTTGSDNVAVGRSAMSANTTGASNTAVGKSALQTNITSNNNTAVGDNALSSTTGAGNTAVGVGAGTSITSGANNTIIGGFQGNQHSVDLRASSNHVVLSDGDGNPRLIIDNNGKYRTSNAASIAGSHFTHVYDSNDGTGMTLSSTDTSGNTHNQIIFIRNSSTVGTISTTGSNTAYGTSSDYRLKENVDYTWDATSRLKQLKPARFNFIIDPDTTVDGFIAHEVSSIVPEAIIGTKDAVDSDGNPVMQSIDQSKLVPLLVKTIQELEARIATLEAK